MATATVTAVPSRAEGARALPGVMLKSAGVIWAVAWKEIRAYFTSFLAYVLAFMNLLITWILFLLFLTYSSQDFHVEQVLNVIPQVFLFSVPLITMRLFSEERNSGTIEVLLTSPVTEWQVVLGKFVGSMFIIFFMVAATFHLPWIATRLGQIDLGPVRAVYLGTMLIGASFLAIGLFMSSLSDNQVVSGFLTFGTLVTLLLMGNMARSITSTWMNIEWSKVIGEVAIWSHLENMVSGDVHSKDIFYFAAFTFLFLYLTTKSLESRKWR